MKNLIHQGGYARPTKKRKATEKTIEILPKQKIGKIRIEERKEIYITYI